MWKSAATNGAPLHNDNRTAGYCGKKMEGSKVCSLPPRLPDPRQPVRNSSSNHYTKDRTSSTNRQQHNNTAITTATVQYGLERNEEDVEEEDATYMTPCDDYENEHQYNNSSNNNNRDNPNNVYESTYDSPEGEDVGEGAKGGVEGVYQDTVVYSSCKEPTRNGFITRFENGKNVHSGVRKKMRDGGSKNNIYCCPRRALVSIIVVLIVLFIAAIIYILYSEKNRYQSWTLPTAGCGLQDSTNSLSPPDAINNLTNEEQQLVNSSMVVTTTTTRHTTTSRTTTRATTRTTARTASQITTTFSPNVLIQQHIGATPFFNRSWDDMLSWRGEPSGDFWYGLESLHRLTTSRQYKLRVDLMSKNSSSYYEEYATFVVGHSSTEYLLSVSGYTGNTGVNGGSMHDSNGMKFSTWDRNNDKHSTFGYNCALRYGGGWWYRACYRAGVNCSPQTWFSIWSSQTQLQFELSSSKLTLIPV